jgi:hypothetical protein
VRGSDTAQRDQPGRHELVRTGLIALVLAIAISAGLFAAARHRSSAAAGSGEGAPTPAQAQSLLDRQARAVLDRDRPVFVSDLDPSAPAMQFRSAQQRAFDNLRTVPIASWRYQLAAPVNGPAENQAAARRYGTAVLIMRVEFSYALRDVDPAPAAYQLYLTFVRRDGRVRVAGDADLADAGGASWHGPWEFGPIVAQRGRSSLILGHPAHADELAGLAAAVDAAVPAVTAVWGAGWNRQVVVVVPDTQPEMNQVIASTLPLDRIAASTYVDTVTNGRALGARIAVNPANLSRLDPVGLKITITHEVTLVATWATKTASTPTWLSEGFAEYVANLGTGQAIAFAASELDDEVRAGTLPASLPTTAQFSSDSARLPQVYEQAWLACRLIAELGGSGALPTFFGSVSASGLASDAAVEAALQAILHVSTATFTELWQQYLRAVLT